MTPKSRPFLVAKRIDVSMPWSTLITRRIVFDAIQMTDWDMYVELFPDGSHNFPKFTTNGNRPTSAWTTTLEYVRASRGQFTYEDHGTPWSTIARNLDVTVSRPASDYRGQAHFSNGTVAIQSYVPMRADMATSFHIVDGKIVLDSINLRTDGAQTQLTGIVDATRWPEQIYRIKSKIDFPTEKGIWFAHDKFTVAGTGDFTGTFHLFKEQLPDGKTRTGRELKGDFVSAMAGVNAYRFSQSAWLGALGARQDGSHQCDGDALRRQREVQLQDGAIRRARDAGASDVRRIVRERRSHDVHRMSSS